MEACSWTCPPCSWAWGRGRLGRHPSEGAAKGGTEDVTKKEKGAQGQKNQ